MTKKVVIVGAGPAGLAAAYKLAEEAEVTLIDQGKRVLERKCPSPDKCINCHNCQNKIGVGGAGTFSDGKFIFETLIGPRAVGSNLHEIMSRDEERKYLIEARKMFEYYLEQEIKQPNLERAREIESIARINDMDYIVAVDHHIGTDKLPELIDKIQKDLEKRGVKIVTEERVQDFTNREVIGKKSVYDYDFLIVAPGRDGCLWLESLLNPKEIGYSFRPVDIGFRVETDEKVLEHLVETERDVKLEFHAPNGDKIRTFCVCPQGIVTAEKVKGKEYRLVNGMSASYPLSSNTNFALLTTIPLRKDIGTNSFAQAVAIVFEKWAGEKVSVQRLGDLLQDRSSKEHTLNEWRIKPTLKEVNMGDVGVMPYRHMRSLLYGLKKLDARGLLKGINQYSTLLYGPEIKFHGIKIDTDKTLKAKSDVYHSLYFAGDGSGFSRGIGGAMANGIVAAEGIIRKF